MLQSLLAVAPLLLLSGPTHEVPAEPIGMLPLPTYDVPFDDQDEAATQVLIAQEVLTFLITAQSYQGQTQAALRGVVAGELVRDDQGKSIYSRALADHGVLEGYDFRDGSLVRGQYVFLQRPINRLNEFIDYYAAVKQALTDSYGRPIEDQVHWENDLYRPLPDYWGVAVMIGYLRYVAVWETSGGTITISLTGDRHSKLTIDYRSRAFVEQEQRASIRVPSMSELESS